MAPRYILTCLVFIFCRVDGELLYGLKGLSVSLEPAIPTRPADILWKYNANKLVEFDGNKQQVYGTFQNRITLDRHTAELEITDLRFEDSGNYDLEADIKNQLYRSSKKLVVIDKVSKPTISCRMNDSSSSNKSGTLECSAESNHSQTQSLTEFAWESHGNVQRGRQLTISLGDEHDEHVYICNASNPKSSEATTFTAKDCYPDKSSSVALVATVVTLSLIIFVVLGIAWICYKKRKACFAVRGADEESPPGQTKNVSDNHNMTPRVEESQPLLHKRAGNQSPGTAGLDVTTALGNGNSQDVDEPYQQVPIEDRIKMFGGRKGGKMNKAEAPPVPPCSALPLEPAKKEDPADEPADLGKDKMSHQESSAAPEESDLETTLCQSDGEMNKDKAPPVPPCSESSPEPAEEEVPHSDPSLSEKANEPDQADESADSEEDNMSESSCTAPEESELKKEAGKDGEANVPSHSVSPAKALSPLTQNSPNVAPENAAGEQSEDVNKPVSTPEKEPVNEEIEEELDLYGDPSQQPQSPIPTKADNKHTNTAQESPDTPHKTPDQQKNAKTTFEDEDETAQCGPKEEKPDR